MKDDCISFVPTILLVSWRIKGERGERQLWRNAWEVILLSGGNNRLSHSMASVEKLWTIYQQERDYHSIKLQVICDTSMRFTDVFCGFPGSTHSVWECNLDHIGGRPFYIYEKSLSFWGKKSCSVIIAWNTTIGISTNQASCARSRITTTGPLILLKF